MAVPATRGIMIEEIRRFIRARLGARSSAYKLGAQCYSDALTILSEGAGTWRRLRRMQAAPASPPEPVRFSRLQHPILLRPGTKDIQTAIDNFVREEYGAFDLPHTPRYMVDAGAYIGDTTAYFLSRYPELRVCALEPAPESFALASRNLELYGERVVLSARALAGRRGIVSLTGLETGARISNPGDDAAAEIETTTVLELLSSAPNTYIDLLKMDIEGAEQDVFENGLEAWADYVGTIIVEPHGQTIERLMVERVSQLGWRIRRRRNLYCFGNPWIWA